MPDHVAELPASLASAVATARAALPGLAFDERALVAALERDAGDDLQAHLATCHVVDLALATAARDQVPGAIEELLRRHQAALDAACRRFANRGHAIEDLQQIVRSKLFVGPSPRIADYAGRGSLSSWLRVIAARELIDLTRRKDRLRERGADDAELEAMIAPADLQLDAIKAEYRSAILAAMRDAVRDLESGDRHLLRQHLIAGLTFDQLASVLGLGRATVARRIARARDRLASRTRELAATRLGLGAEELAEVYALVHSRLELSLPSLLATPTPR